jgi:hypothetical protein
MNFRDFLLPPLGEGWDGGMHADGFANSSSCAAAAAPIPTFPQRGKESNHITLNRAR